MSLLKTPLLRVYSKGVSRHFSATTNLVDVSVNNQNGVATVKMNRPPVNSLNFELLEALHGTFAQLETDRVKGMILTSTSPKVFSAGLDIMEMYKPNMERAHKFWTMLQDTWIKLYSSPYPTAAAINGHAPAGGCLLALSCEYRVIVPKVTIGLNEAQLGIVAPPWFQDCMRNTVGERQAEKALISGKMFTSEEAFKVGLVDDLATDIPSTISKCEEFLAPLAKLPSLARQTVKNQFRGETLQRLVTRREADTKVFLDYLCQPKVQQSLELYLTALKSKK